MKNFNLMKELHKIYEGDKRFENLTFDDFLECYEERKNSSYASFDLFADGYLKFYLNNN